MAVTSTHIRQRKHIRYRPDPLTYALIDEVSDSSDFAPKHIALVVDESLGGCGLIVVGNDQFLPLASHCRVKVGELSPLKAEVAWRCQLDDVTVRLGLAFLE